MMPPTSISRDNVMGPQSDQNLEDLVDMEAAVRAHE